MLPRKSPPPHRKANRKAGSDFHAARKNTMALGASLRQAREAKGQTLSQVAEATRIMVQVVEDLEREDFRRIAAPIYGRGFLKLYAEHLEIDPEPLIREFMEIYTGARPAMVARRAPRGVAICNR